MIKTLPEELLPKGELLSEYIRRIRELRGLSKSALAERTRIHVTSIQRLENGQTGIKKMRKDVQERLSTALQIPVEYIRAALKGEAVEVSQSNKVCLTCWTPGTAPDMRWSFSDAKFCLRCASALTDKCIYCSEPILLKGRFCHKCGKEYKKKKQS